MLVYLAAISDEQEKSKFEHIYNKYYRYMFCVANSYLHNVQDAEDAVQDAFLSIIQNMSKFHELESQKTKSLISIITERRAIDLYTKKNKIKTIDIDSCTENELGISVELPEESDLAGCILNLPVRYREMILLKYGCGYSTRECAEILGLSRKAAVMLDQRAKSKLETMVREVVSL